MTLRVTNIQEIDSRDRTLALCVACLLFACYLLTYTAYIESSDGLAMFATTESMVRRGELDSNQLIWMGNQQGNFGADGDLYSRKGLGMALLTYPLMWIALLWPAIGLAQIAMLLNPILTAWTGGLLFRAGRRLGWSRPTSVVVALIFGLATMAWPYAQTFFSDPVCAFGLFAAFYGLLSYSQTARKRYLLMGSLAWGLAYLTRVVNLVTLPIFAVGLLYAIFAAAPVERPDRAGLPRPTTWREGAVSLYRHHWRPLVTALIPIVVVGLVSLWWNWARYGSVWDSGYVETERFDAEWWFGVSGLIAGPARGIIWYSPVLLLAIPSARLFWRQARPVFIFAAAISLLYVLLYGKWYMWHGGYSWGPRFLAPIVPFLTLLTGPILERVIVHNAGGILARLGIWLLVLLSVAVQWLGLLIPYGLVQDELAATFSPLFAPETFTHIDLSPLVMQWRYLQPENIHLAWWRADSGTIERRFFSAVYPAAAAPQGAGAAHIDWIGLLLPLAAVGVGAFWLLRQLRQPDTGESGDGWLNSASTLFIAVMTVALLLYTNANLSNPELARAAARIRQDEQAGDAIVLLRPTQTQDFANVYHGKLPLYAFFAQGTLDEQNDAWLAKLRQQYNRLWLLPDDLQPQESGWERLLRGEDFLLFDTRMSEPEGQRLALYATVAHRPLQEAGLGTIFGDPALAAGSINSSNGWIRLEGYALSPEATPGGELLLALRWESLRPMDYDYQVFVHLLNAQDEKLAQRDGQPVQWLRPTSTWHPGEKIIDRYGMILPNDLPAGSYAIAIGLYDPVSGQRLPISAGPRDYAIELGPIVVANQ
jgi:hypothetical protein